jgi:hypothetical protein
MFLGKTFKPAMFELEVRSFDTVENGIVIKTIFDVMAKNNDWEEFSPIKLGLSQEKLDDLCRNKLVAPTNKKNKYVVTDRFIGKLIAAGSLIHGE